MQLRAPMIGREAKKQIDQALSTTPNPTPYLKTFRQNYSLQTPTIQPMLSLFQHCGHSPHQIHKTIFKHLCENVLETVGKANTEQLEKLHHLGFQFIGVPELRAISLLVLERLNVIPKEDLEDLGPSLDASVEFPLRQEPYAILSIRIKQKIWKIRSELLKEELLSTLREVPIPRKSFEIEELVEIKSEEQLALERERNGPLQDVLKLIVGIDGRFENEFLALAVDIVFELSEDQNRMGYRQNLMTYSRLFADLMLEARTRTKFSSEDEFPNLQAALKSTAMLSRLRAAEKVTKPMLLDIISLYNRCQEVGNGYIETMMLLSCPLFAEAIARATINRMEEIMLSEDLRNKGKDDMLDKLIDLCWRSLQIVKALETKTANSMSNDEVKSTVYYFVPTLCQVIVDDYDWFERRNVPGDRKRPDPGLDKSIRLSALQRRLFAAFGIKLYKKNDILGLSRFRHHFDTLVLSPEPLLEDREKEIGRNLVVHAELQG